MNRTASPLEQVSVLVTRPEHQAAPVCALLSAAGATALRFPALAIEPVELDAAVERALVELEHQQLLVFTSANAVTALSGLLSRSRRTLPVDIPTAAIGRRTGALLRQAGMRQVSEAPAPYDSEALLAEPIMQRLCDRRAMLVTGQGGRGLLPKALYARGAQVSTLAVYRRVPPSADPEPLRCWLEQGDVDVVIVTSGEALDNLLILSGERQRDVLLATPMVTLSSRIAQAARQRGFHGAIVVTEPGDTALVQGVVRWRRQAEKRASDD
ncbi:MAG: uroporphyrinogen-III synthase [Aquisalimonadaceae bacterium]